MNFYYYICYFVIYAFLGWCTEVAYQAVHRGKFINRGFLNGPVCPVYGFGMVTVIYCLSRIQDNALLLFLGAVLLTSAIEWLTGFVLEKVFHAKWWDYSDRPLNINGYICLEFSIIWGLACLIVMDAIQPCINALIGITPLLLGKILLAVFYGAMLADAIVTVNTLTKLNKQLAHLQEISASMRKLSDSLGENIYEGVTSIEERKKLAKSLLEEKKADFRENIEDFKENMDDLKEDMESRSEVFANELRKNLDELTERYEQRKNEADLEAEKLRAEFERKRRELEEKREEWSRLREEYRKSELERHFGYGRILKAFPDMKHKRNAESLEALRRDIREEILARKVK